MEAYLWIRLATAASALVTFGTAILGGRAVHGAMIAIGRKRGLK